MSCVDGKGDALAFVVFSWVMLPLESYHEKAKGDSNCYDEDTPLPPALEGITYESRDFLLVYNFCLGFRVCDFLISR